MTTIFFKQKGTKYFLKTNKIFPIIGLILFIAIEIYFLFFVIETKDSTIYKIVPLIPIIIYLIEIGKITIIDLEQKTIETSIFKLVIMNPLNSMNLKDS